MNCPGSVLMFSQGLKSYRDLPLRMAEFGKVHRYEPSGALHGLLRVRHFTQDDAHIYCTEEQMEQECIDVIELILDIYKDFGFDDVVIKFSDRSLGQARRRADQCARQHGTGIQTVSRRGRVLRPQARVRAA
jgi:threonyl-tRNA synthetase